MNDVIRSMEVHIMIWDNRTTKETGTEGVVGLARGFPVKEIHPAYIKIASAHIFLPLNVWRSKPKLKVTGQEHQDP